MAHRMDKPTAGFAGRHAGIERASGSSRKLVAKGLSLACMLGVLLLLVVTALAVETSSAKGTGLKSGLSAEVSAPAQEEQPEPEQPIETPEGGSEETATAEPEQPIETPEGEPEETATPEAEDGGHDGVPIWAWIVVGAGLGGGALLVIGGLGVRSQRGRSGGGSTEESQWRSRALDAYGRAVAIHDTVSTELGGGPPAPDAVEPLKRRWQDLERRINDVAADLHALEVKPPDPTSARTLRDLLATLGALRSAVESDLRVRTREEPAAPTDAQLEESAALVRRRLSDFDGSLQAFKAVI